jgi:hypothetical protein
MVSAALRAARCQVQDTWTDEKYPGVRRTPDRTAPILDGLRFACPHDLRLTIKFSPVFPVPHRSIWVRNRGGGTSLSEVSRLQSALGGMDE